MSWDGILIIMDLKMILIKKYRQSAEVLRNGIAMTTRTCLSLSHTPHARSIFYLFIL